MKLKNGIFSKETPGHHMFQMLAMLTGSLSIISSGMHYGWTSPSLPKLEDKNSTIPVTSEEGSWMAVMPLIGATVGSLGGGVILDIIGRKKAVLLTSFPFFAAWIMIAYAKSVIVLLAARFVAGIADGLAFCAVPMYLGEIADPKIRGFLCSSCSITWILGMLLINIIGSYTSIRTAALISSTFPVLLILTFMWMPESPYFLIMKEQPQQAKQSLRIFKGVEDVDADLNRLSEAVKEQNTNTGKLLDLFTEQGNRRAVLIIMGIRAAQQCSGTMAISFYAQTIFKNAGDNISSATASIIYFAVQLIISSISSAIVDKTGRRPLLIFSISGAGLALLVEGIYFYLQKQTSFDVKQYSFIPVGALILYVVVFGMGLQAIPILLLGELFATNVKAFALCLADIYFNILATLVSKFFQIMKDSYGLYVPFFVFTGCCVVGLVYIIFCIPETKGKTLEEIQLQLKGKTRRNQDYVQRNEHFKSVVDV